MLFILISSNTLGEGRLQGAGEGKNSRRFRRLTQITRKREDSPFGENLRNLRLMLFILVSSL